MPTETSPTSRDTFPGTDLSVNRMGFGAMQLAGRAVLNEAITLGIDHINTSDFYGPHVTNDLIRETLHPYAAGLVLVTKIGAWRDEFRTRG